MPKYTYEVTATYTILAETLDEAHKQMPDISNLDFDMSLVAVDDEYLYNEDGSLRAAYSILISEGRSGSAPKTQKRKGSL